MEVVNPLRITDDLINILEEMYPNNLEGICTEKQLLERKAQLQVVEAIRNWAKCPLTGARIDRRLEELYSRRRDDNSYSRLKGGDDVFI